MSRSTLGSFSFGIIAAVLCLSLSPLNEVAHADPGVGPADQVDIIYGDGDEGALYIGPVAATPHQTNIALAPADVLFADADQGAIDAGAAPIVASSQDAGVANAQTEEDLVSSDSDVGGAPVDPSALAGRNRLSAADVARD
jgi:hypothetical protein